jgi:hypothetical protein
MTTSTEGTVLADYISVVPQMEGPKLLMRIYFCALSWQCGHTTDVSSSSRPVLVELFEGAWPHCPCFQEILSRAHANTEEQNRVLEPSTIIIIFLIKNLLEECDKEQNVAVTGLLLLLPVQKKNTVKRSAQCHVFAQSPPDRRPNDKYPVNTSHRSDMRQYVSLQRYLVATVIHIQSARCQWYTHSSQYYTGRAKEINIWTAVNAACHFGQTGHRYDS